MGNLESAKDLHVGVVDKVNDESISGTKTFTSSPIDVDGNPITSNKGFKNYIINGGFDIWQRGVSFNISGSTFTADRWYASPGIASTSTISRLELEEEVYNILNRPYALSWEKTVAGTGPGWIKQIIENGAPRFAGKTVTLSFWARAVSGSLDLNIITYADYGSGGSAGETIETKSVGTINKSAWNKYVVTFTFPDFADKTIDSEDNNIQLFFSPDNANSLFDFQITNVQLEEGSVATPFEQRPIGLELSLCQRYYQKVACGLEMYCIAGNFYSIMGTYTVPPRVSPTLSELLINTFNVAGFQVADIDGGKGFWYQCLSDGTPNLARQSIIIVDAEIY